MSEAEKVRHLSDYSGGRLGTRAAIERLGLRDYADLVIELARHDLPFPKPDYPGRAEHLARARAILHPRLRRDAG
jgi:hypothetical protein